MLPGLEPVNLRIVGLARLQIKAGGRMQEDQAGSAPLTGSKSADLGPAWPFDLAWIDGPRIAAISWSSSSSLASSAWRSFSSCARWSVSRAAARSRRFAEDAGDFAVDHLHRVLAELPLLVHLAAEERVFVGHLVAHRARARSLMPQFITIRRARPVARSRSFSAPTVVSS